MTPAQCRAARALLQWSQDDLARKAGVNAVTVRHFENEKSSLQRASISVMRQALTKAGVVFIDEGHRVGPGVGMQKAPFPADEGLRPQELTSENDG
jgi:transcriptional regulator with XRE-family HTH domain